MVAESSDKVTKSISTKTVPSKYNLKMESNDKLKEIDINSCTCYYFDDIIKIKVFDFDNISLDKKSYKIFLI